MKFLISFLCLLLVACASDPKYKVKRPFLYEVEKDGKVGYLFGTMHVGVTSEDLPDSFWPYFDRSDIYINENGRESEERFQKALQERVARAKDEPTLEKKLKPDVFAKYDAYLRTKYPAKAAAYRDQLSVVGAYSLLSKELEINTVTVDHGEYVRLNSKFQLDDRLERKAKDQGKVISHLDNPNYRDIAICLTRNEDFYIKEIEAILNGKKIKPNSVRSTLKLAQEYRDGNAQAIRSLDFEGHEQCLLKDRNQLWLPKLTSLFDVYTTPFVAVGAAHLEANDGSLIELLTKKGFKIKRLEN
jgi:uncharacterized protein YbaP (TraB family)